MDQGAQKLKDWMNANGIHTGGGDNMGFLLTHVTEHLRKIQAALNASADALARCEKQFTFYAEEHKRQGKTERAATNYGFAVVAGRALERVKLAQGS